MRAERTSRPSVAQAMVEAGRYTGRRYKDKDLARANTFADLTGAISPQAGALIKASAAISQKTPQIDLITDGNLGSSRKVKMMQGALKHAQIGQTVGLAKGLYQTAANPAQRAEVKKLIKDSVSEYEKIHTGGGKYQRIEASPETQLVPYNDPRMMPLPDDIMMVD